MADCKFILGFALTILVASTSASGITTSAPTAAPTTTAAPPPTTAVTHPMVKAIEVTIGQYNLTDKDLSVGSKDFKSLKPEFEKMFLDFFKTGGGKMGDAIVSVEVTQMRKDADGNMTIIYNMACASDKEPYYELKAKTALEILADSELTLGNMTIPVHKVKLTDLDMILTTLNGISQLEIGIDKEFNLECNYNRTDKSDRIGVKSIQVQFKPKGKTNFEDIATIVTNMWSTVWNPYKVSVTKLNNELKSEVSGLLTRDGTGESFIKLQWIYPSRKVIGVFKCVVQTIDINANAGTIEKSIILKETLPVLTNVIENVIDIDLKIDSLRDDVELIDDRALHIRNKIIKNEFSFMNNTYLLAKNVWGNTVAAQTFCQVNGAHLVEINTSDEWMIVKGFIAKETGPVLAGATNKQDVKTWRFMKDQKEATILDWSTTVKLEETTKRCMAFQNILKTEGFKMINIECSGMLYESFLCELPTQQKKQ